MDTKDILNKIKWQLYMRLPNGGIYEKCKDRIQNYDNDYIKDIFNGNYLDISVLNMYIRGYYSINKKDVLKFYEYLLNSKKVNFIGNNNFINFEIDNKLVTIPAPDFNNINELISYRFELLDLIIPYLLSNIDGFKDLSFNEGPYEYSGKYINLKLNKNDCVLDLGANFGMFSALAASKGCDVYSFEPLDDAIDKYLNKLKLIYPNIHIINKAVSNKTEKSFLNIDNKNYGGSFISNEKKQNCKEINVTTIDKFVSENNLNNVNFIKADIEGIECEMLEGAKYTLKYFHPNLSLCKYHHLKDKNKIKKLILSTNPNYIVESKWKKIYAQQK